MAKAPQKHKPAKRRQPKAAERLQAILASRPSLTVGPVSEDQRRLQVLLAMEELRADAGTANQKARVWAIDYATLFECAVRCLVKLEPVGEVYKTIDSAYTGATGGRNRRGEKMDERRWGEWLTRVRDKAFALERERLTAVSSDAELAAHGDDLDAVMGHIARPLAARLHERLKDTNYNRRKVAFQHVTLSSLLVKLNLVGPAMEMHAETATQGGAIVTAPEGNLPQQVAKGKPKPPAGDGTIDAGSIAEMVKASVSEALKPVNDRFAAIDAEKAKAAESTTRKGLVEKVLTEKKYTGLLKHGTFIRSLELAGVKTEQEVEAALTQFIADQKTLGIEIKQTSASPESEGAKGGGSGGGDGKTLTLEERVERMKKHVKNSLPTPVAGSAS